MREFDKIINLETIKGYVDKLDKQAQINPSKITIDFPKSNNNATKDFFNRFFNIADGNPEWYN